MTMTADVEYDGIVFTVQGEWIGGYPETRSEPGEDSGFDDVDILYDDLSFYELLDEKVRDSIIEEAERFIKDECPEDEGEY